MGPLRQVEQNQSKSFGRVNACPVNWFLIYIYIIIYIYYIFVACGLQPLEWFIVWVAWTKPSFLAELLDTMLSISLLLSQSLRHSWASLRHNNSQSITGSSKSHMSHTSQMSHIMSHPWSINDFSISLDWAGSHGLNWLQGLPWVRRVAKVLSLAWARASRRGVLTDWIDG